MRIFPRFFLAIVPLFLGAKVAMAAPALPPPATATYSGGECRLRLQSITQRRSVIDPNIYGLELQFGLEFSQGSPATFAPSLPADLLLNNDKTPFVAAHMGEHNIAKIPHAFVAQGRGPTITISNLELGAPCDGLTDVELEVEVVRVTDWDHLSFAGLGKTKSDLLHCGPFELRVTGERQTLEVEALVNSDLRVEHDAFRRRVPLKFLTPRYGFSELKIVDTAGHVLSSSVLQPSAPGSGAVRGTFAAMARAGSSEAPASTPVATEIVYPVTLTLDLPKKFSSERLKFHFDDIAVPPPK